MVKSAGDTFLLVIYSIKQACPFLLYSGVNRDFLGKGTLL